MRTYGWRFKAECTWDECFSIDFGINLERRAYCLEQHGLKSHRKYVAQADLADFALKDAQGSCTFDQST